MAHVYSLTDGTTTVTLDQASGIMVTGFVLDAPDISTREITNTEEDGGEIPAATYRNITQTIDLIFIGASTSALQTLAHSVENLLYSARKRQEEKKGARVYIQIQIDSEASTWRSEILNGALRMGEGALQDWIGKKVEAQLIITRRYFWEGPEKELQLSTSAQSAATGGRTIYNHDDVGEDNYVQIAAAQVGGVLPTPVKLTLQNTTGGAVGYRNLYLAVNAFSDPTGFIHILEGENRKTGYGTVTGDANQSGGNYNAYSFTNTGEIQWVLGSSLLTDTQGRWFRLLMRAVSWTGTNIYVKPVIKEKNGLITLWESPVEYKLGTSGTQLVDLGAAPLPPGNYGAVWGDATLSLVVRATGAGSLNIDFIQLTPLDSYRHLVMLGNNVTNNLSITDDGIENVVYMEDGPIFSPKGKPLMVFPNRVQRLIVLQDTGSASNITQTFSIRAYIRERRLTV